MRLALRFGLRKHRTRACTRAKYSTYAFYMRAHVSTIGGVRLFFFFSPFYSIFIYLPLKEFRPIGNNFREMETIR